MTGEAPPPSDGDPFADSASYWEPLEPTREQKERRARLLTQAEWPALRENGRNTVTRWVPGYTDVPDPAVTLTIHLGGEQEPAPMRLQMSEPLEQPLPLSRPEYPPARPVEVVQLPPLAD